MAKKTLNTPKKIKVKNKGHSNEEALTLIDFDDYKNKIYGKAGSPKREQYEQEFKSELIGEFLREIRREKDLTQSEIAKKMGIKDKSGISKIENNLSSQRIDTIIKFILALDAKMTIKLEYDNKTKELELV
jgi:HTH-type transcriptional regulator / antitoxin HipB